MNSTLAFMDIQSYLMVHKAYLQMCGDMNVAYVLSNIMDWNPKGWLDINYPEIVKRINLPEETVRKCITELVRLGIFKQHKVGTPLRTCYKLNTEVYNRALEEAIHDSK